MSNRRHEQDALFKATSQQKFQNDVDSTQRMQPSTTNALTEADVRKAIKDGPDGMVAYQVKEGWTLTLGKPPQDYVGFYYTKDTHCNACLKFAGP